MVLESVWIIIDEHFFAHVKAYYQTDNKNSFRNLITKNKYNEQILKYSILLRIEEKSKEVLSNIQMWNNS